MATITSAFVCANPNTKIFKTKIIFCYLSNPNKFQISCQGIDLRRQKSFNFLKKYFKSKQKYLIWKWVKINELMWLSISTKVLDCFSPKKMAYDPIHLFYMIRLFCSRPLTFSLVSAASMNDVPIQDKKIMNHTRSYASIT